MKKTVFHKLYVVNKTTKGQFQANKDYKAAQKKEKKEQDK
jgi:hypothetical protein